MLLLSASDKMVRVLRAAARCKFPKKFIIYLMASIVTAAWTGCGGGGTSSQPNQSSGQITFTFGPEQTVFTYATDACEPLDVPDTPAHAVRLPDGSLFLDDGDAPHVYGMFGSGFSSLHHDCTAPLLISDDLSTADTFDNQEWVESVYRVGGTIHGLIHNEFHDPIAADCKVGDSSPANPCWYNSITYGVSTDGGHTFTHAAPPAQLLAPAPQRWDPTGPPPPYGYFEPSNVVQAQDGFYYVAFGAIPKNGNQVVCVMRTSTLGDPTSWRAWDGSGFNVKMTDPYTGPPPSICSAVAPGMAQPTLTFNTYLGKYLLVGSATVGTVCGAAYALSSDLLHWSAYQIMKATYVAGSQCLPPSGVGTVYAYFSIIDHNDTTTNFEKSGKTPFLYYTRIQWNNGVTPNRDLVRVPVVITLH
ncbi:MAG TPA: hypothetical protein VFK81_12785 [Terriglobales bacterium]|nr:hypothetical protein [Terriglobales bacterium]